jgi:rare lipoprotein A
MLKKYFFPLFILFIFLQLSGCASMRSGGAHYGQDGAPNFHIDVDKIPNAVPKVEPLSKYGNPPSYVACGKRYYVMKSAAGYDERGIASWYGMKFYKVRTSSGEMYDVAKMTAAHRTLPLPTYVQVTNLQNGKQIIVKVNDRGPFANNRIIDLSYVAAVKLGVTAHGTALVEVKAIDPRHPQLVENQPAPHAAKYGAPVLSLQIGAFSQRANAEALAQRAKTYTDYPIIIKTVARGEQTLYRVQIGPIPTVDDYDSLANRLEAAGLGKPIAAIE